MARKIKPVPLHIQALWATYETKPSHDKKNKLIDYYFPFVKKVAWKVAEKLNWQVHQDELASFGVDGLQTSIDKFNLHRGIKFESFAAPRIRGAMIDGLRREDAIPRSVRISFDQFERHKRRLENHVGYRLSDSEFASLIGMDELDFQTNGKKYVPIGFSSLQGNVDTDTQEEMQPDCNASLIDSHVEQPYQKVARKEFYSKLMSGEFSKLERKIIYLHYYKKLTMHRVGESVGLSESRVSQLHRDILDRLYKKIERNPDFRTQLFKYAEEIGSLESLVC
ncbi:MAG: sigma-70 family RNA polymerase sigma factor [Candidatus Competibacteraceae bacterium]|nr:sigma-70 family RNA polymerase sigma factor [Candidatus Competibacteraceae bacterium]